MNQTLEYIYMIIGGVIGVLAIAATLLRRPRVGDSRVDRFYKRKITQQAWVMGSILFIGWLVLTYMVVIK